MAIGEELLECLTKSSSPSRSWDAPLLPCALQLQHVHRTHGFGDGRFAGIDQVAHRVLEAAHPLRLRVLADLLLRRAVHDHLAEFLGDRNALEHPGALIESRVAAMSAAGAGDLVAFGVFAAHRSVEVDLVGTDRDLARALRAVQPHQPLRNNSDDR